MEDVTFSRGVKDLLSFSLTKCLGLVGARSGSIFLLDPNKKQLILEIAKNSRAMALEGLRLNIGEGVSGQVALKRKPLLVRDADEYPLSREGSDLNRYDTNSFLSVPLEHSGDLLGVINITDREAGGSFDHQDLARIFVACRELGEAIYSLKKYIDNQKAVTEGLSAEIKQLKKTLEHYKNFSSLGKLAGGFVHEISNPLDGIIRYVNLSHDGTDESSIVREYLLEAKQGLSRVVKIVRSLLDFSWNLSKASSYIDVNKALEECLFIAGESLKLRNINVVKNFVNLPALPDFRLKIVFSNIIKNACAAMNNDKGLLEIATNIIDDKIVITFSDNGMGIPEDIQDKVFDPFFTTKKMGEGTGLGLAICYETIQRYDGKITVESKVDKGTTFNIQISLPKQTEAFPEYTSDKDY